jgi:F-type H+-transporting ATPase subunit alpha
MQFSSELDEGTRKRIERGKVLTEILKQPELEPVPFEFQVVLIWATTNGYFDEVGAEKASERGLALLEYINKLHREEILEAIRTSGDLSDATEAALKSAATEFNKLS